MISFKDLAALLSILITCVGMGPYLRRIHDGHVKPHFYTWCIWSLTTSIAALARTADRAGPGAWGQWAGSISCIWIAWVSYSKGERQRTVSDQVALAIALLAIPVWVLTKNPLFATIIVTVIDAVGYYPTFRKTWNDPYKEAIFNYVAANLIHFLSLAATEHYSVTTILFPTTIFICNSILIAHILIRRRMMKKRSMVT